MPHITRFITAFASVAVLACSAADETAPGELSGTDQSPSEVTEGQILHELTVAGESIQFLEYAAEGDSPSFMLHDTASAYVKQSLLERLQAEAGELTLLETFYALAPAGAKAHPDLERFHAEQVAALGRVDSSVHRVAFDVNQPVEKSISGCDNWAAANAFPGDPWDSAANNSVNMPNGGNLGRLCRAVNGLPGCDKLTIQGQFVGACNDGPGDIVVFDEWRTNSQGWKRDKFNIRVSPGQKQGWRMPRTTTVLKTQTLAITCMDDPDFISPAYWVRARGTF